jgi:hypothetical protein
LLKLRKVCRQAIGWMYSLNAVGRPQARHH